MSSLSWKSLGWRRSRRRTRRNPSSCFKLLQTLAGSTRSSFVKAMVGTRYGKGINSHVSLGTLVNWRQHLGLLQQNASWNYLQAKHFVEWTQLAPVQSTTRRPRFMVFMICHLLKPFHGGFGNTSPFETYSLSCIHSTNIC